LVSSKKEVKGNKALNFKTEEKEMRIDNTQYLNAHGCNPKGKGFWFFDLLGTDGEGRYTRDTFSGNGTVAQARKQAVAAFKRQVGGVKQVVEAVTLP
jgi:hypothetical protein